MIDEDNFMFDSTRVVRAYKREYTDIYKVQLENLSFTILIHYALCVVAPPVILTFTALSLVSIAALVARCRVKLLPLLLLSPSLHLH